MSTSGMHRRPFEGRHLVLGRIKLFVIAVEKTTAGRLQQLQRGGRLVGPITASNIFPYQILRYSLR